MRRLGFWLLLLVVIGVTVAFGGSAVRASVMTLVVSAIVLVTLLTGARRLLSFGGTPMAVARVVADEAVRKSGVVAGAVAVLTLVCALPLLLDSESLLLFRTQSYMTYALAAATLALTLLTVFLSCDSLAGEISNRQIHLPAVKPVGRAGYLLGKWFGILVVNSVLLTSIGGAIAFLSWFPSVATTGVDAAEVADLRAGLLTSRKVCVPRPPAAFGSALDRAADRSWRSIAPGESEVYAFEGIAVPSTAREDALLRVRVKAFHNRAPLRVVFQFDGGPEVSQICVPDQVHEFALPAAAIADGALEVTVRHPADDGEPPFIFSRYEGLRVVYPDGDFLSNFLRGLLLLWTRLAVITAAGLFASSFLGFPVASLAVLLFVGTSSVSDFLLQDPHLRPETSAIRAPEHDHSHGHGGHTHEPPAVSWAESFFNHLEVWGFRTAAALSQYQRYDPHERLVTGQRIEWREVGACLLWFGGGCGGALGLAAWLVFRRRELARVQV
ncbi:MAG: hypothetical protein AAF581_04120 [Planctomycetota bacterium]